jgi:hypothetical protein
LAEEEGMTELFRWIAVRCCCQPQKVLGFIRLPQSLLYQSTLFLPRKVAWGPDAMAGITHDPKGHTDLLSKVEVQLKTSGSICREDFSRQEELAIYSDDRPIEFWREIVGFVEVKQ